MERLRLGRTTVYEQARLYLATGGAEGIPCRRFGKLLRFPAAAFDTVPKGTPAMVVSKDGPPAIGIEGTKDNSGPRGPRARRHTVSATTTPSPEHPSLPFTA
jgi:hypothetical protein